MAEKNGEDLSLVSREGSSNSQKSTKSKRLSVERIYQKKTQLEHVLLRPDTYIGSVEFVNQLMWVYDGEDAGLVCREISFVPGLYKIFDEILVNAADNKQRDANMNSIKVDIQPEENTISVWNNGRGIPVMKHEKEKMYVPTLIFGSLLTSSNYNDDEKKVTGGRNGFGAKLCNIFSLRFTVETSSVESNFSFKQTWKNNMSETKEPRINPSSTPDFTKITFQPDLTKFKMDVLDMDTVALLSRRAYDIAGSTRGVTVCLNGRKLPVKGFKDYIEECLKGQEDDDGKPLKAVFETVSERWEVGLAQSNRGFQQISFVNNIATTKGGRHVDHVADQIVSKVAESVRRRNKAGINIKPFQIKNHMWLFVNCLIENPTFDSQTKENMTLEAKNFGSTCSLSEKFFIQVLKCGIVDSIMTWIKFKAQTQLNSKCHSTKHSKIKGIPKLEDANDAGSKNSMDCTLILTEGDSAKTLAVSGLGVVGRDRYGVFPLRGKMLNVREASHKQILENAEINNVIKIMGLQYKREYSSLQDLRSLRYGRLMIMTDQDQDGSHIKGLLINFIHHNWPGLLRLPFLEEFITPIVKATKKSRELSFYSLPEFEEWKTETPNWNSWKVKYYKGLGTSTSKEAKEYFSDMVRHRITFSYRGAEDDDAIQLAFSRKMIDQRKDWLSSGMGERKRRRELGLPELYLYNKDTKTVSFKDFVNKELILFSNLDNERSIPSLIDGLKPGQRKVIYTCLKRNDKREVKVAQLAGSVAEHSAYHHGEVSLMSTIINLAQNYVGSNNINLLQPIGQFGTRLQGGKDSASPRYIFTMLSPLARHVFNPLDEPLLNHLYDDNQRIEPEYYVPVIPMVLVNGAEGIGTGWSTKIPNYNPRDIVANLRRMMAGEDPIPMMPWFKNFSGTIERLDLHRYVVSGELAILSEEKLEITELPVRTWTQAYKESVLEVLLQGTDKSSAVISDYKEYNTDTTVKFVVFMSKENLSQSTDHQGLHKLFRLQTSIVTSSMVLFDSHGCLRRYESPESILREFFPLRLTYYERRKVYLMGMLGAEARLLSNQARFIMEKCDGVIIIENRKKVDMIQTLVDRGFDSDPVKTWRKYNEKQFQGVEDSQESEDEAEKDLRSGEGGPSYDYLLGMPLWSLTKERKDDLLRKRDRKKEELNTLEQKSPSDLWEEDLTNLEQELERVETKEREDELSGLQSKKTKGSSKKKTGQLLTAGDTRPTQGGQRVEPKIDPELRRKVAAAQPPKEGTALKRKERKQDKDKDGDSDGEPEPLAKRVGNNSSEILQEAFGKKTLNQRLKYKQPSKVEHKKSTKTVAKKKPISVETDSESEENFAGKTAYTPAPDSTRRRTARTKASSKRYLFDSDSDENQSVPKPKKPSVEDGIRRAFDEVSNTIAPNTSSTASRKNKKPVIDTSSEDEVTKIKALEPPSDSSDDGFDSVTKKARTTTSKKSASHGVSKLTKGISTKKQQPSKRDAKEQTSDEKGTKTRPSGVQSDFRETSTGSKTKAAAVKQGISKLSRRLPVILSNSDEDD